MPAGKTSSPAGIFATCEAALLLGMAAEIHLSGVLTYGADLDPLNRHIAARHAAFGIHASVFQTDDLHVEEADVLAACRSGMLTEIVRIHIADSFDISLVVVVRTPDDVLVYFSCGGMSSPMAISSSKALVMNSARPRGKRPGVRRWIPLNFSLAPPTLSSTICQTYLQPTADIGSLGWLKIKPFF